MQKILIPVDGSELSLDALRYGLHLLGQGLQAQFVLANVQEPPSLYEMLTVRDPQILEGVSTSAATHLLEAARALCDAARASYECEIASGDPAHTLIDIVERHACDCVIMGARGKSGLAGPLLGSVSQVMVHDCPVPVTVVKHAAPEESLIEADTETEAAQGVDAA